MMKTGLKTFMKSFGRGRMSQEKKKFEKKATLKERKKNTKATKKNEEKQNLKIKSFLNGKNGMKKITKNEEKEKAKSGLRCGKTDGKKIQKTLLKKTIML